MKQWFIFLIFLSSLFFSGCSFRYYFVLGNATDDPISIHYTLKDPTNEGVIFEKEGAVYQSKQDYSPNWEHPLPYRDLNNSDEKVVIKLGAKSSLVFGTLSNDKYDAISMKTSEGKVFNLVEMTFTVNGVDYRITKDNFHDFFLEESGTYKYVIQP